jgi:hypothetical protein
MSANRRSGDDQNWFRGVVFRSQSDPGCVKTRRRSIAIEQVTRSRPFHVPTSEAHSILKSKSRISFSARFELSSFHTAWTRTGHSARLELNDSTLRSSPSCRVSRSIGRHQSLVDARDNSFQSAPCCCQFIRMWRLVALFLPSAAVWLSPTQWNRTIAAVPTTRIPISW